MSAYRSEPDIAEAVAWIKSPFYVRGSTPKWLEDMVDKIVREG